MLHAAMLMLGFALAASSAPSAPAAQPTMVCSCLEGITIGDDPTAALAKVGSHPISLTSPTILSDFESFPGWMLTVYYGKTVVAIAIETTPPGAPAADPDPFGVKLGDSQDQLTKLRGKPDAADGGLWRYGPADGLRWIYSVENGVVARIAVSTIVQKP